MKFRTTLLFSLFLSSLLLFHWSNSTHVIKSRSSDWSDDDSDFYDIDLASSRCHPNPCENNGICHDTDEGITCTCAHGYLGHRCQGKSLTFMHPVKRVQYKRVAQIRFDFSCMRLFIKHGTSFV